MPIVRRARPRGDMEKHALAAARRSPRGRWPWLRPNGGLWTTARDDRRQGRTSEETSLPGLRGPWIDRLDVEGREVRRVAGCHGEGFRLGGPGDQCGQRSARASRRGRLGLGAAPPVARPRGSPGGCGLRGSRRFPRPGVASRERRRPAGSRRTPYSSSYSATTESHRRSCRARRNSVTRASGAGLSISDTTLVSRRNPVTLPVPDRAPVDRVPSSRPRSSRRTGRVVPALRRAAEDRAVRRRARWR